MGSRKRLQTIAGPEDATRSRRYFRRLSSELARHVAAVRFAQLPKSTVHASKRALLDAVGVMHAASGLAREVRPFIDLALRTEGRARIHDPRHGCARACGNGSAGQWRDVACAGLRRCFRRSAGASGCLADSGRAGAGAVARARQRQETHRGHRDGLRLRVPARAVPAPTAGGRRLVSTADFRRLRRGRGCREPAAAVAGADARAPGRCCCCRTVAPARSSTTRTR